MSNKKSTGATDAQTEITTFTSDGFVRTALVVKHGGKGGSVDIVGGDGRRLAQINLFVGEPGDELLMVDVIDVDQRFKGRYAITFGKGGLGRWAISAPTGLCGVHFTGAEQKDFGDMRPEHARYRDALRAIVESSGPREELDAIARKALGMQSAEDAKAEIEAILADGEDD